MQINRPVSENHPSVPAPKKKQGGTLVIIRQPKPLADGSTHPNARPDTIVVQIPREPRETPPSVFADSGSYHIEWTPIRAPYVEFLPTYHVGMSVDTRGKLSPWLGVGILSIMEKGYLGAGVDLGGVGPFAGVEVTDRITVNASYRILRVNSDGSSLSLSLAYRF